MKNINNLYQLLSRVKNIFGRKATPATNAATSAEPPTDISVVSDSQLKAALADIEKYLADNFGTPPPNCAMRIMPTAQASSRKTRHSRPRLSSSRTLTASTTSPTT